MRVDTISRLKPFASFCCLLGALLVCGHAHGGFTETLPKATFLLAVSLTLANISNAWDDEGNLGPIIDEIKRYEPGGSLQGIIRPNVEARYLILVNLLQYGILDNLSLAVGVPVVLETRVEPNLEWEEGDYQWTLGRPYSEKDFWEWAASMGQPRPGNWTGNQGQLTDMPLGLRYRFTDGLKWFEKNALACAITLLGALPTGSPADPEEAVAAGPTVWNLRFQGGFGIYDAPEPWGPWTTVYFSPVWDVGPGETSSFPTKWMSEDGKTLHLVFSGDDFFSVRKAILTVQDPD